MNLTPPRTALDRLRDERRMLTTLARLIVDDVPEAIAAGATDAQLVGALGLPGVSIADELAEELDALRRWAT